MGYGNGGGGGGYGGGGYNNGGGGYSGGGQGGGYQGNQGGGYQGKTKEKKEYPLPKTFAEAKAYKINFGKYKGQTLNQIAIEDEGLRYLKWFYDKREDDGKFLDTYTALQLFLSEPVVVAALEAIPSGGGGRF